MGGSTGSTAKMELNPHIFNNPDVSNLYSWQYARTASIRNVLVNDLIKI